MPGSITRTLKRGDTGEDVAALQSVLVKEGLLAETDVTATYDPNTQMAVAAFQRRYKIPGLSEWFSGHYCGEQTLAQIRRLYP
jgi:peptidoglycan hydrolase-like protein with peptidoglycan-binding domain